jgi:hypothetical protein
MAAQHVLLQPFEYMLVHLDHIPAQFSHEGGARQGVAGTVEAAGVRV